MIWILTIIIMTVYMFTVGKEDPGFLWVLMVTVVSYIASAFIVTVLRSLSGKVSFGKLVVKAAIFLHVLTNGIVMWSIHTFYHDHPTRIPEDMGWELERETIDDDELVRHYNVGGAEIITRIPREDTNDEEE